MANYTRLACGGLFLIFAAFTFRDIFVDSSPPVKEIPAKLVKFFSDPRPFMEFLFCYSCGYRKLFDDYTAIIQQKYPEMNIRGRNFEPPTHYLYFVKLLGVLRMGLIFCILSSINLFQYFRTQEPSWWSWCLENKLYSCVMIFFLCNAIEGHLISTGAFEITLNGLPVWSKLETGRIPQPPELFQIIDNQLRFDEQLEVEGGGFGKL